MADPYLAEIRIIGLPFAPKGWALCNGQILPINQNQALFSLLGTTYGGDGRTTFALPNLQSRMPMHTGSGYTLGQLGGEAAHTLTTAEMPAHTHAALASEKATVTSPASSYWASPGKPAFGSATDAALSSAGVGTAGGSQPHPNMPPFLALSFVIAVQGIFPSQS